MSPIVLACGSCKKEHDSDACPDTGVCPECGGPLLHPGESPTSHMARATEAMGRVLKDSVKKLARARVARVDDTLTRALTGDPDITFQQLKKRRKSH